MRTDALSPASAVAPRAAPVLSRLSRFAEAAFVLAMLVFYALMTSQGLRGWFSSDDLMNLYLYWTEPWRDLLAGLVVPGHPYYRPAVALLYRLLHETFGFDAAPFRIVQFLLSGVNVVVLYIAARLLSRSAVVAACATIFGAVHASLVALYYDFGMIYDVVVFLFYFAVLAWYAAIRRRGRLPSRSETISLFLLTLAAIKSKESAVSIPVALALFELVLAKSFRIRTAAQWMLREGRMVTLTGALVALNLAGRYLAADPLLSHPAYRPEFSLARFLETSGWYLRGLLYLNGTPAPLVVASVMAGMILVAIIARRPILIWSALFVPLATIPVGLIPPRNGFAYVIPAFGYFVYAGGLIEAVRQVMIALPARRWSWLNPATAALTVAAVAYLVMPLHVRMFGYPVPIIVRSQAEYSARHAQLRALLGNPPPRARVLAVHDPSLREYDLKFLLCLSYGDPYIDVVRVAGLPDPSALRGFDYAVQYRDGAFLRIPSAPDPHTP